MSIYCMKYIKSLHKMATNCTCVQTSVVSTEKTVRKWMGFVDCSEKLIKRTIATIMCTKAKYIALSQLKDGISSCGQ